MPSSRHGEGPPSSNNRAALLDLVEEDPGQSLLDAAEQLDVHVSTVSYHARRLEDDDRMRLVRDGRCVRLFPETNGLDAVDIGLIAALKSERAEEVLRFLADNPGATKSEAADALGMSVKGLDWHVGRLSDLDLVRVDGDRRGYSLSLADGVEERLTRVAR